MNSDLREKNPTNDPVQTVINGLSADHGNPLKLDADYFSAYSDFSPITVRSYTVMVHNNANVERDR